jgi:hypothetical protein
MLYYLLQKAPFMKLYTEYVNNFDTANERYEKLFAKKKKFAAFLEQCYNIPEVERQVLPSLLVLRLSLTLNIVISRSNQFRESQDIGFCFKT